MASLFIIEVMANSGKKLKPSDFVHLHNHTHYSLLDGLTKLRPMIARTAELKMNAIAITDHGLMSGAIEFYKAAKEKNIKSIIGMEAYVAARSYKDKDSVYDRTSYHLTMLAINDVGYQNLMRLSTIANLDGFYYRPRIDKDLINKYNEGIIVLSGCMQSELSDALRSDQYEQAKKIAQWYKAVFDDRYYLELQDHGHQEHPSVWDEQSKVNKSLLKLGDELDIPAVVTCDSHYLMRNDQEAHEALLCIQTGAFVEDNDRMSLKDFQLHIADPEEIIKRWGKQNPELILNTRRIADQCDIKLELGKTLIPTYPTASGETEKSLLEKIVWRGLAWRYGGVKREEALNSTVLQAKKKLTASIISRTETELAVIDKIGYNGFFLIVNDFVNWGKDKGIVFGPGRGSTAGSIVAYATRITDLDPLKYDLLFERFLTADRVSPPDMDIDIQDSRRDEVINYCIGKYGQERVANIVTFGTMAARNSVRDVARVLRVSYADADKLAKMIPPPFQGRHTPLATHLKRVSDLKKEYAENSQSKQVFDLAIRLEGTIRSHGVHAAGVIIAPDDLVRFVPLEMTQKGVVATQYSMGPIEDLGLLKIDFLGLSNLTIIKNTLRIVKKVYGKNIDISQIPLDDKKTYELLQRGETTGVFQLESSGMKRYLKQLKPNVFDDIIAMVSLYRPGPLTAGLTDKFISRKHGREKVSYEHGLMESALASTYGVLVYQEQVMQIVQDMCGFTGSEADTLRKAVGKKQRDTMAKMKVKIIKGAVDNNVDKKIAVKLWQDIEGFADYAFNKSHAACYALIAYQTAYLKASYPAAFMAALMTSDYDNIDRLAIEITECKHMKIEVLPPDINQSFHEFGIVPDKNEIRFGLDAIKNVGHGAVEEILNGREKSGGEFKSIEDFCKCVNVHIVNRKALESLIKSGAFDSIGDRSRLLNNIENILSLATRLQKETLSGQVDLFGGSSEDTNSVKMRWDEEAVSYSQNVQLAWERDLLGLYLSSHPLEDYAEVLSKQSNPISRLSVEMDGSEVILGGSITNVREITTKNGSKMAFAKIADMTGEIELIIFPKLYELKPELWIRDNVILAKGRLTTRDRNNAQTDEWKVIVEEARLITPEDINQAQISSGQIEDNKITDNTFKQKLFIKVENSSDQPLLMSLKDKLDSFHGDTEVVLVTGSQESKQAIKLPQTISVSEESLRALASIFGSTNIVVK